MSCLIFLVNFAASREEGLKFGGLSRRREGGSERVWALFGTGETPQVGRATREGARGEELVHFAGAAWHPTVGRMEKTLTLPSPTKTRARVPEGELTCQVRGVCLFEDVGRKCI
ncbi:hypothetical protein A6X21_06025 [Planctopirus hydrillae]|uniref:Uncharacterized protein n=1 Tax=Planctopirus hydrillae TaxID=1841610 RepID=A0A1C3EAE8_9PLAN|nr:hypothetical protein A6X21_06025 [Planctopirus hydrillae]